MKAEIKGEDLLVYCNYGKELDKFVELNNIKCAWNGAFKWSEYSGVKTHAKNGKLIFWFLSEHLLELKFN